MPIERAVRATRAYLAGIGTAGALALGAALVFAAASAIIAFRGWPGTAISGGPARQVLTVTPSAEPRRTARRPYRDHRQAARDGDDPSPGRLRPSGGRPLTARRPTTRAHHRTQHRGSHPASGDDHSRDDHAAPVSRPIRRATRPAHTHRGGPLHSKSYPVNTAVVDERSHRDEHRSGRRPRRRSRRRCRRRRPRPSTSTTPVGVKVGVGHGHTVTITHDDPSRPPRPPRPTDDQADHARPDDDDRSTSHRHQPHPEVLDGHQLDADDGSHTTSTRRARTSPRVAAGRRVGAGRISCRPCPPRSPSSRTSLRPARASTREGV